MSITVGPAGRKVYYLHSDHLNTPRVVTDEQNRIVWRNSPLAETFGTAVPEQDPDGDGIPFTLNLRFPGQYYDRETGLNYNYFRDYDSSIGRYVQSDPIGLNGGINTYAYGGGNPVGYTDPSGLFLLNPVTIGAVIGGVAGAIQAANSSGGLTPANAGNIVIGAITGAVAGAIPGGIAASAGVKAAIAVGGAAGAAGNLANQWAGGTSWGCTNWTQAGVQGAIGTLSGGLGYGAGLSSARGVVRSGGSAQGAATFGNIYGAMSGGAVQIYANLPISTNLGGLVPASNLNQCGCSN